MMAGRFSQEILVAERACCEASALVLDIFRRGFDVSFKQHGEPVTLADRRANEVLCARLQREFPHDAIVAEESTSTDPDEIARITTNTERVWFVDPLDGTKEFIRKSDEFAVMVGLAVGGTPVLGVIAAPATAQVAVGVVDAGAWVTASGGVRSSLHVSRTAALSSSSVIVSRSHRTQGLLRLLHQLGARSCQSRGSFGLKAWSIADGSYDLHLAVHQRGGAKLWDGCAAEALVRAAGGRVSDLQGLDISYRGAHIELQSGFIASNAKIHDQVVAVTRLSARSGEAPD